MKKIHDLLNFFCADRIDVITNFAVITNVVIKRVHCIFIILIFYNLWVEREHHKRGNIRPFTILSHEKKF